MLLCINRLAQLNNGGIIEYWYQNIISKTNNKHNEKVWQHLELTQFRIIFIAYCFCILIAIIVQILEFISKSIFKYVCKDM